MNDIMMVVLIQDGSSAHTSVSLVRITSGEHCLHCGTPICLKIPFSDAGSNMPCLFVLLSQVWESSLAPQDDLFLMLESFEMK